MRYLDGGGLSRRGRVTRERVRLEAARLFENAGGSGGGRRAIIKVTAVVAAQARSRLAGVLPDSATRVVSLHDRDARPIVRGRLGRPSQFGYKAQVVDNTDGIIVDYTVEQGNPADAPQLAPAIARVTRRAGRPPRAVTADRGDTASSPTTWPRSAD
jgi:transposase, IS5 family